MGLLLRLDSISAGVSALGSPRQQLRFDGIRQSYEGVPLAPKTDLFKKLYIETIIRNPKKVGFSGHR